jgi:hypothetical protein
VKFREIKFTFALILYFAKQQANISQPPYLADHDAVLLELLGEDGVEEGVETAVQR